jgi:hypothetical protein
MADDRKSMAEHNARRVAEWLANSGTEFEQRGVAENQLASAVGLPESEMKEAVDYLENREDVVRFSNSLLKPGRGWPELRASIGGRGSEAGARPSTPDIRA